MPVLSIVFAALILACTTLLIIADIRKRDMDRLLFKTIASMLFLFLGFLGAAASPSLAGALLFAALIACLAGDIFLAYYDADMEKPKRFIYGIAAFSAAQLFLAAHSLLLGSMPLYAAIAAIIISAGALFGTLIFDIKPGRFLPICGVYMLLLSFAFASAVFGVVKRPTMRSWMSAAGMALFVISDAVLLFKYFKKPSGALTAVNLYTYYLAVTLLAASSLAS